MPFWKRSLMRLTTGEFCSSRAKVRACIRAVFGANRQSAREETMRQRIVWIAAALLIHCSFAGHAQHGYPSRPVRMVVTVPPGGAADFVARIMAQKLGDAFGDR